MKVEVPKEQILYGTILYYGTIIGLFLIVATFAIYVAGLFPSYVSLEELPELWKKKTHDFVEEAKIPTGWDWIAFIGYGDFLNLLIIAVLAFLTIVCYIAILPVLIKKKDWIYTAIALIEIVVLLLAASGLISAGH